MSDSFLFLDTNSFITALKNPEFAKLLREIKDAGCSMLTIRPVVVEFLRGTDSIETYNTRADFLNDLVSIYPIEKFLDQERELILILKKVSGKVEYTDFLLGVCVAKYSPKAYLLTENHHDFSTSLFERTDIITVDNATDQIRNHALYYVPEDKLTKIAQALN